jgi:elongation factor G
MKTYQANNIKNIALLGNAGSGKTSLAEALLFLKGIINRKGAVEKANTVSDYNEAEHQNGNSVFSSLLFVEHNENKINIIDTPGSDDFTGGVVSALSVIDAGLMVINAQNGVEVGTEIQARQLKSQNKPLLFLMNHLDNENANFEKSIENLKERFGGHAVVLQFPVNPGIDFNAIIDVITMKMHKYDENGKVEISDIPDEHKAKADELRNELIEKAAENDEQLMEIFFEKETLTEEELQKGIKAGVKNRGMFPVFCSSASKNVGLDRLLDFIVNCAPSPNEMPAPKNTDDKEIICDPSGTTALFVFKSSIESHIGEINYFKVMSGEVTEGSDLNNTNNRNKERLSQLYVANGKERTKVSKLSAGDLGATVKLKSTKNNHTLVSGGESLTFPAINFPEPKYRAAIKLINEGEEEKLGEALQRMHDEDPTIIVEYSKELKQIILHGQGEHHLDILKWHLDNIFKIESEFITPKIPYRETITKVSQADYRHKKQSGGAGQFGEVHMIIDPYEEDKPDPKVFKINGQEQKVSVRKKEEHDLEWGGKLIFYNCIVGGSIDAKFMPAIVKGIMEKMEVGPLTGSYARDIRVSVYDGKMHPVDSNEVSFKLAGRNAFQQAFKNAAPKILEPIYLVDVFVPSDKMGDVMTDLQGRRAIVLGMNSEDGFEKISAKVPLAEMNKYSTALSSLTNGRATYTMKYSEYSPVPGEIQEELLKSYEAEQQEEE